MGEVGAAKAWIESNRIDPLPAWLSKSEAAVHNDIFAKGGYVGPLNWYKVKDRNLDMEDESQLPKERKFIDIPTLVVVSDEDYVTQVKMAERLSQTYLRKYKIEVIKGCGHWIPLERKDEFSQMLVDFAEENGSA